jgi:hypothetical protein
MVGHNHSGLRRAGKTSRQAGSRQLDYDGEVAAVSRIANYQPEKLLASAGFVDTFRARAKGRDGLVALKVLFLDRAGGDAGKPAAQRFLAAGRRLLESHVPGTAQVLDVSDELEAAFVASELLPGLDLSGLVALSAKRPGRGKLDPLVAGLVCADVAETLAAAHAARSPAFHLGLCPGNVVVTPAAKALVLDFGLTAALRASGPVSLDKWLYVAPELMDADAVSLAPAAAIAADLYSLGMLLHFLLSGRAPAPLVSFSELRARRTKPLPDVAAAPKQLQAAVRALTAPDAKDRPESAQTVVAWLSSGMDSRKERGLYVASALKALGVKPVGFADLAVAADGAEAKRPAVSVPAASLPPSLRSAGPSVATAARAARSTRWRRWLWLGLATVAIAAGTAFAVMKMRREKATAAQTVAKRAVPAARLPSLKLSQVEVLAPVAADGGIRVDPLPTDRVYMSGPRQKLRRVPGHLDLATDPDQADVWVDGALMGKTPVDLVLGPGGHRVVAIKPGYRMLRAVYDTTEGEYARRDLQRAVAPTTGDAFLDVDCSEPKRFPVFLDDEETGLLCPVKKMPVVSGRHTIGIFVPAKRTVVTVDVTAIAGPESTHVVLDDD